MKRFLSTIAFLFLSPVVVYALGLGDVVVNSALNQPLDGKIELLSPSPDDLDSLKIGFSKKGSFLMYFCNAACGCKQNGVVCP